MQTIREAATEKDLQKLDSLTHHLRSSWEVLRCRPTAKCTLQIASWRCTPGW